MRSRFEEYQEDDHLDEPVTITGRQLRQLKRAATTGLIATILAIIAVGLGAWNLVQAGKSSTTEAMSPEPAQAQPAPVATDSMSTPAPQPIQTGAAPATQPTSTPPAAAAPKPTAERHAAATKAPSTKHARSSASSTPSGEEPLTVPAFTPSAAPVSPAAPAPTPVAPTKSAGADTSGH